MSLVCSRYFPQRRSRAEGRIGETPRSLCRAQIPEFPKLALSLQLHLVVGTRTEFSPSNLLPSYVAVAAPDETGGRPHEKTKGQKTGSWWSNTEHTPLPPQLDPQNPTPPLYFSPTLPSLSPPLSPRFLPCESFASPCCRAPNGERTPPQLGRRRALAPVGDHSRGGIPPPDQVWGGLGLRPRRAGHGARRSRVLRPLPYPEQARSRCRAAAPSSRQGRSFLILPKCTVF